MSAVRQDAWSPEDDLMLAEVTLRHIREGSTQLLAFEEVGERIGRTAAACGFRWNSCVRKKYDAAIQIAKAQRQKRSSRKAVGAALDAERTASVAALEADAGRYENGTEESVSFDGIIRFLRQWKGTQTELTRQIRQLEKELREKDEELARLREENERLSSEVNHVQTDYRTVNDDYKALIQIMDRARKMAFLVEDEEELKSRFKMDANGNLERIE
ncbi:RsfA family transcriptional regulator [Paenibacillus antri]|uniref:RsfA family transcriptional regulator n=1 Tax=Paenibacillus antri TaxID=2582848 RepID=A0A5R9G8G2_9BACL|nr:RsfA family transcriptional regulator [Paenibacillus antri]TLS50380.1 RsfA family transcriptional regulator [Paenibacillus antri]